MKVCASGSHLCLLLTLSRIVAAVFDHNYAYTAASSFPQYPDLLLLLLLLLLLWLLLLHIAASSPELRLR
jgi:hypothetical protein